MWGRDGLVRDIHLDDNGDGVCAGVPGCARGPVRGQAGSPAPFGKSVKTNESPPVMGSMHNCGGSGLPSFSVARTKSKNFPSFDQRGEPSCLPPVN